MTTGDVVYSLRFSLIKILPEPGFDLGSTAGESCVLTARLHMLYIRWFLKSKMNKLCENVPVVLSGNNIDFVHETKYLGVIINLNMMTSSDVVRQTRKFYAQANM